MLMAAARDPKLVILSTAGFETQYSWSYRCFLNGNTLHSGNDGDSEMTNARELWEQNQKDPSVKKLNDALSKNSESSVPSSSPSVNEGSEQPGRSEEVLYGMNPKRVQSLKSPSKEG